MKKHFGPIVIGLIIVAILSAYMVTFTVRWQEKALVLTFGKITRQESEPGLKWIWPWQSVVKFDGRVRTLDQQTAQTQTRDKINIISTVYINWRIDDAKVFYERFRKGGSSSPDVVYEAENTIRGAIADAANIIAEYNMGELVTLEEAKFKLPQLEGGPGKPGGMFAHLVEKVSGEGGYGIEIVDLGIKRMNVPDSVSEKVFERMKGDREAVITALLAEGQSLANSILGDAQSRASIIEAKAKAKAKDIKGRGDAEAAQYYARFLDYPQLANYFRKLETLRTTLNGRTTIVLDSKSPPYNLLQTEPSIRQEKPLNQQQTGDKSAK